MAPDSFAFMNQDGLALEADVINLQPDDFAATGARVGGDGAHRVHPRTRAVGFDEREKFVDLREVEEQTVPEGLGCFGVRALRPMRRSMSSQVNSARSRAATPREGT